MRKTAIITIKYIVPLNEGEKGDASVRMINTWERFRDGSACCDTYGKADEFTVEYVEDEPETTTAKKVPYCFLAPGIRRVIESHECKYQADYDGGVCVFGGRCEIIPREKMSEMAENDDYHGIMDEVKKVVERVKDGEGKPWGWEDGPLRKAVPPDFGGE